LAVHDITPKKGLIVWHPIMGHDPEQLTEDQLVERLKRLPFGGCSLRAADEGGMYDLHIGDALGFAHQTIHCMPLEARFRNQARRLGIDFR